MTLYRPAPGDEVSLGKGLSGDTFYARFTQRLIAALSTYSVEGGLYDVDMQLRPSGTKGPVAVSMAAFESYYAGEAETWELLAMTRGRVVWATTPDFAAQAGRSIEAALRRPRDAKATARDVIAMRALMKRERPAAGFWDMKLSDGGLVDIEFAAQYLQLIHAAAGGPLRANTGEALAALAEADLAPTAALAQLSEAWSLQQDLSQLLKIALEDDDPSGEPKPLKALLAQAGGVRDISGLTGKIRRVRGAALSASRTLFPTP
jgi:glutamate-ammonia-ligase adenylyltransferase